MCSAWGYTSQAIHSTQLPSSKHIAAIDYMYNLQTGLEPADSSTPGLCMSLGWLRKSGRSAAVSSIA